MANKRVVKQTAMLICGRLPVLQSLSGQWAKWSLKRREREREREREGGGGEGGRDGAKDSGDTQNIYCNGVRPKQAKCVYDRIIIALRASCGAVCCNHPCLCVCVCLLVCYHDNLKLHASILSPHQTGFVGEESDHLQLITFCPSRAPGNGFCGGVKFFGSTLLQPALNVCVFSWRFFHSCRVKLHYSFHGFVSQGVSMS